MKVIGARWSPLVNYLTLLCDCGNKFETAASRRWLKCDKCGRVHDMLLEKRNSENSTE